MDPEPATISNRRLRSGLTLVLGGARSGKSAHATELAERHGGQVLFVATAEALDDDMRDRIERHRRERPSSWSVVEEPRSVARAIRRAVGDHDVVIVDCLTLLVSNLLLRNGLEAEAAVHNEIEALAEVLDRPRPPSIVVSNEVGLGLVPDNRLGRGFRDLLGFANRRFAEVADHVVFLVAGVPISIKEVQHDGGPRCLD